MIDDQNNNEYKYDIDHVTSKKFCSECNKKIKKCPYCEGIFEILFFNEYHRERCEILTERHKKTLWEGYKFKDEDDDDIIVIENDEIKKMCKMCEKTFSEYIFSEHKLKCSIINEEKYLVTKIIDCDLCGEKISIAILESHRDKCIILKRRQEIIKQSGLNFKYPSEWDDEFIKNDDGLEPSLFNLPKISKEFIFCETRFKESVPNIDIYNIYRIQHKYLFEKYYLEKQRIIKEKGTTEEKWLFHGTKNTEPRKIYMNGFDICFANQGMFGFGNYFALQAVYSYSNYAFNFSGKSYLFLCKVLTGKSYVCKTGRIFTKPPEIDYKNNIFYDSVTNYDPDKAEQNNLSQMYIVYENDKAYPFYIIEYVSANSNQFYHSKSLKDSPIAFLKN